MRRLVNRHAPASVTGRVVVAVLSGALTLGTLLLWLFLLTAFDPNPALFVPAVFGLGFAPLTYWLAASVVRRASEAPEPDWWRGPEPTSSDVRDEADPVETLKRRYAAGELSTEEFERRLDRIVETDERRSDDSDREPAVERT